MKKQLIVALGLAVLATPAFATRARLEALGEDSFGSYIVNDNRNQFLNPAQINNHKDLVTFEFGRSGNGTSQAGDSVPAPRAQGGVNKAYGNMVYGLHFGDSTPNATVVRGLSGGNTLAERNPIDLFVGGDAGMKWGANLTYEQFNGGAAGSTDRLASNALRARGGVIMGDTEILAQVSLKGTANDYQGNAVDGKTSYLVGVGHLMNGTKYFADYTSINTDYTNATTADQSWKFGRARLGAGRVERLNDKANLIAKVMVQRTTIDNDGSTASASTGIANGKVTQYILPLNVGLETEATSWLTLRASVTQYLWSTQENKPDAGAKSNQQLANTAVRAGATLKFGELSIDGVIGTDAAGDNVASSTDASTSAGAGSLRTDRLMSRVAMTYRF